MGKAEGVGFESGSRYGNFLTVRERILVVNSKGLGKERCGNLPGSLAKLLKVVESCSSVVY